MPHPPVTPWRRSALVGVSAVAALAATLVLLAWNGTSRLAGPNRQIAWLNAGVSGIIVLGLGLGTWLLLGHRAVSARRRRVLTLFDVVLASSQPADKAGTSGAVAGCGMRHFHRPSCQLAVGRTVDAATPAAHAEAGRRPCPVCSP